MNPIKIIITLVMLSVESFSTFDRDVSENRYFGPLFGSKFDNYASWWAWFDYTLERLFIQLWGSLLCRLFGHTLECSHHCGPDSGSETLYCPRCGWHHHITYY